MQHKKPKLLFEQVNVNFSVSINFLLQADAGKYSIYKAASVQVCDLVYVQFIGQQ